MVNPSAAPAAISPNGDGVFDSTTISATFQIAGKWGLAVDSEKALAESRRTPFFLDVTVTISGPGEVVRVLTQRLTVSPVLRPKGTPADTFFLTIPFSQAWNGRRADGAVPPDGTYAVAISGTLLRIPVGPPLAGGLREQVLAVSDSAGVTVTLDTTAPLIVDFVPPDGSYTAAARPAISAAFAEGGAGIDPASATLRINSAIVAPTSVGAAGISYAPPADLPEGAAAIEVSVADIVGNVGSASWTFNEDRSGPAVALSPADGAFTGNAQFQVTATFADPTLPGGFPGSGVSAGSAVLLVDGVDRTSEALVGATDITWHSPVPLSDGPHTIAVSIADLLGNPGASTATVRVDTVPPTIADRAPADGSFTRDPRPTISASYSDATSGIDLPTGHLSPAPG